MSDQTLRDCAMETLYHRIGGEAVVDKAVDLLYTRVLHDGELAPFFESLDMGRQKRMFRLFLNTVTGGPQARGGIELRAAHAHAVNSGLSRIHMLLFVEYLRISLLELNVEPEVVYGVIQLVSLHSDDVLGM